jgi:glucose-1-phosphate cytidylyltransferase
LKVVILAGGRGTRISEESYLRPKPMIEIGGNPILWHIMKIYSHYGFNEFIICLGYKGYMLKEYFADYYLHTSDITFDFSDNNKMIIHNNIAEPWKVTLVDTGLDTQTGGRIKRIQKYIGNEPFMLTYGDGVSDVNILKLVECHRQNHSLVTMTAIQPGGRFGVLDINQQNTITRFVEKDRENGGWINAGFMVVEPQTFDYIENDATLFEKDPLETIASQNLLQAFKHKGFWKCMDTQRDKLILEELWSSKNPPWKIW